MAVYVVLYATGMVVGLLANMVFDVQLRRPGTREALGFLLFLALAWGALAVTNTPFTDVLLPVVWMGLGLLVALGSREARAST